ncbi:ATP-binding protein [Streptomyces ficellus]
MPRPDSLVTPRTCSRRPAPDAHCCELAADLRAPHSLRMWIAALLDGWHLPRLQDDLALIATELATNAVEHAGTAARITLAFREPEPGRRVVRLEVEDSGPGFAPRSGTSAAPARDARESCAGRGLQLVAALSSAWGARPTAPPASWSGPSCAHDRPWPASTGHGQPPAGSARSTRRHAAPRDPTTGTTGRPAGGSAVVAPEEPLKRIPRSVEMDPHARTALPGSSAHSAASTAPRSATMRGPSVSRSGPCAGALRL